MRIYVRQCRQQKKFLRPSRDGFLLSGMKISFSVITKTGQKRNFRARFSTGSKLYSVINLIIHSHLIATLQAWHIAFDLPSPHRAQIHNKYEFVLHHQLNNILSVSAFFCRFTELNSLRFSPQSGCMQHTEKEAY
jgi:hypothetical protein